MSYLNMLKRKEMNPDNRWIVKYDNKNEVREVKLIFNPDEYRKSERARPLHNKAALIKILEDDKA